MNLETTSFWPSGSAPGLPNMIIPAPLLQAGNPLLWESNKIEGLRGGPYSVKQNGLEVSLIRDGRHTMAKAPMHYLNDNEYCYEDGETREPAILMGGGGYLIKICLTNYTVYSSASMSG